MARNVPRTWQWTRSYLACAKPILNSNSVEFITVVGADSHETDTVMAKKIAEGCQLKHVTLPRERASPSQIALFIKRNGHCVGDSNALYHPSVWPIAHSHIFFGGLGGEFARAFLWRKRDTQIEELDMRIRVDADWVAGE